MSSSHFSFREKKNHWVFHVKQYLNYCSNDDGGWHGNIEITRGNVC